MDGHLKMAENHMFFVCVWNEPDESHDKFVMNLVSDYVSAGI